MIYKETLPNHQGVQVTFELPSSIWAERVNLVGDFNQWDTTQDEMRQSRTDGKWRITLTLPKGEEYEFRYLVNGRDWHNDWHADKYRLNKYGTDNSVVCTWGVNVIDEGLATIEKAYVKFYRHGQP